VVTLTWGTCSDIPLVSAVSDAGGYSLLRPTAGLVPMGPRASTGTPELPPVLARKWHIHAVADRRITVKRRLTLATAIAGLALLTLAGCAEMDAALSQRWVDVAFKPGTSVAQVMRIRAACSQVPNVTADPISQNLPALDIVHSVRFNTTRATNANMAKLTTCLANFPATVGVDPQDASDSGG
jgi:hypothetical protein